MSTSPQDEEQSLQYVVDNYCCKNTVIASQYLLKAEDNKPEKVIKRRNQLYNFVVTFFIGTTKTAVNAVLDTGATTCCVDIKYLPKEAYEETGWALTIHGVGSKHTISQKLKKGMMIIDDNQFHIPLVHVFNMNSEDGIQLLVGCNFIRSMTGGLRIEGNILTFYKNTSSIITSPELTQISKKAIPELDMDYEEYLVIKEATEFFIGEQVPKFKPMIKQVLKELEDLHFIGKDPQIHWSKNQVLCKLQIINPDLTIQDKPPKHVTPEMSAQYKKHTDALLKLGIIRPSTSRHRTSAFIVYSGTSIDPNTGIATKGKERMVFNYVQLNNNTEKDQYSSTTIQKKINTPYLELALLSTKLVVLAFIVSLILNLVFTR